MSISCLWDYDTIEMERQQFPGTLELITGKFLRHSPEYYYWRIRDREAKLKKSPDKLEYYDDMAVAYSKLGNDKVAIDIMMQKEAILPRRYETYANLGTFYLHSGKLEKGLDYIGKAIEINPDAHFGREVYQKLLAEYVLQQRLENGKIPLPLEPRYSTEPYPERDKSYGFFSFLVSKGMLKADFSHNSTMAVDPDLQKALKGIQGMMRFGNYNSPILLEALADLLMQDGDYSSARQLAARAYLQASHQVPDEQSKLLYEQKAASALILQYNKKGGKQLNLEDVKVLFTEEVEEGKLFYDEILQSEHSWIIDNKDLDKEFSAKYYTEPAVSKRYQEASGRPPHVKPNQIPTPQLMAYQQLTFKVPVDTVMANFVDSHYANDTKVKEEKDAPLMPQNGGGALPGSFIIYLCIGAMLVLLIVLRLHRFRMNNEGS